MYEMQHEQLNERSYYVGTPVGTSNEVVAIVFSNCAGWMFQLTSNRSVKLHTGRR